MATVDGSLDRIRRAGRSIAEGRTALDFTAFLRWLAENVFGESRKVASVAEISGEAGMCREVCR